MLIETIFDFSRLSSSALGIFSLVIGWIVFVFGCVWTGVLLPFTYDSWLVNRRINPATFDERASNKRNAAIERLSKYNELVIRNTSWRNSSNVINDFGKQVVRMTIASISVVAFGAFFPSLLKLVIWVISKTM